MEDNKLGKDQHKFKDNITFNDLLHKPLPSISLPNQDGNMLSLNRNDTFRLVIYFYSMTGNPKKKLPENWKNIPGASGCTLENSNFRDKYDSFIKLNSIPIGVSTQEIEDIKEMTMRLNIQFDILSDSNLKCTNKLSLPTFTIKDKTFIKRLTIIVENNTVKKVFYPVFEINKHIDRVLEWLSKN